MTFYPVPGWFLVSVPISQTLDVIERLRGKIAGDCLLADLTSIKAAPLSKMMEVHPGPVVGLHPMFGPTTGVLAKQVVVYCHGRAARQYSWLLDQFKNWGTKLLASSASEHDEMMGVIQALRHFVTFVYGIHISQEDIPLEKVMAFSSPIYRLELGMVGRLFAQDAGLYADIIFSSDAGKQLAHRYAQRLQEGLELLSLGKRDVFIERFEKVHKWFGDLSDQFLQESTFMIEKIFERET